MKGWKNAKLSRTLDPCRMFNYDHSLAQRTYKGEDHRITDGYIRMGNNGIRYKTYLLHINGNIEKEFSSVEEAKEFSNK